jgi:hypothetical protein
VAPLVAEVLAAPVPALSTDRKVHLAYELLLNQRSVDEGTIDSIALTDEDTLVQTLEDPLRRSRPPEPTAPYPRNLTHTSMPFGAYSKSSSSVTRSRRSVLDCWASNFTDDAYRSRQQASSTTTPTNGRRIPDGSGRSTPAQSPSTTTRVASKLLR